jgi:hypothetical protein
MLVNLSLESLDVGAVIPNLTLHLSHLTEHVTKISHHVRVVRVDVPERVATSPAVAGQLAVATKVGGQTKCDVLQLPAEGCE